MACLCPISIPDKIAREYGFKGATMVVPCGHCVECARQRRNDWFVRIWTVYNKCVSDHLPVWFFTATIDPRIWPDMNLKNPDISGLVTPFVRSWNERFRYLNGGVMPLRFMCSEFGSCDRDYIDKNGVVRVTTGALHFHGLIFGYIPVRKLKSGFMLTHGHVDFNLIRGPQAIRYTVKYATKDYSVEDPRLRARVFCSPGIGDPSFYFGDSMPTPYVLINGFHYRTPRYFIEKQLIRFYGRDRFFLPDGHSLLVHKNFEVRLSQFNMIQDCLYNNPFGSVNLDFLSKNAAPFFRRPASYEEVLHLAKLHKTGFSHPTLVQHRRFHSNIAYRDLLSHDDLFHPDIPYIATLDNNSNSFHLNFFDYERSKTVVPLSLDFAP